ncbi:hypothetical protein JXA02_13820 [candidate division KSB1 bacterium]|nr:hypothetical protein [candidate division KSB1 bacterium]
MLLQSEKARDAVRWISDSCKDGAAAIVARVGRAIGQFDRDPKPSEELMHFYQPSSKSQP